MLGENKDMINASFLHNKGNGQASIVISHDKISYT